MVDPRILLGIVLVNACHRTPSPPAPGASPGAAHPHRHDGAMHHRFDDADRWAQVFDDPDRAAWQKPDAVVASLELSPDAIVADLGAGTGYFTLPLARAVPEGRVVASDIEPDMVRHLRERAAKEALANVVVVQGTADDPALPEAVDVVFLCDVYHHIEHRSAYFEKLRPQLRDGARIVIVDFKVDAPPDAPGPPKQHRINPAQVTAELNQAGYAWVGTDTELLPYQYVVQFTVASPETTAL